MEYTIFFSSAVTRRNQPYCGKKQLEKISIVYTKQLSQSTSKHTKKKEEKRKKEKKREKKCSKLKAWLIKYFFLL